MMLGQRRPMFDDMEMDTGPLGAPLPPIAPPSPAKKKLNWGAIIADALSGLAGQQGQYPQRMAREREEQSAYERGEQQYQRRRADQLADQTEAEDRQAHKPYRWESNDGSLMEVGPDGMARQLYKDPTPKEKWVFDPVRGYVNINQQPLQRLDALPPGARRIGNGGPMQPASGNFR